MNSFKWLKGLKSLRLGAVTGSNPATGPNPSTSGTEGTGNGHKIFSRDASTTAAAIKRPPKRPLSPYLRFAVEQRPRIAKANPSLNNKELVAKIGQTWSSLSEEDKQKYVDQFQKEIPKYSKILAEYKEKLTDEDLDVLKKDKLQKELKREKREKRERFRDLERCKEIAVEWRELPEAEKKPYVDNFAKEKAKYDKDIEKWEQKMLELGNTDVVRLNTLKNAKAD